MVVVIVFLVILVGTSGCGHPDAPDDAAMVAIGSWSEELSDWLPGGALRADWTWRDDDGGSGTAELSFETHSYRWRLVGVPAHGPLELVSSSPDWLPIQVSQLRELRTTPPLPRLEMDSAHYPDLVSYLRALITPRFAGRVAHWPSWPIPVRAGTARSGTIDLAACLREAVQIWNAQISPPPFVCDDAATWGIHLAHYAGATRRPPLQMQITRTDSLGRPIRARISVGDDYSAPHERVYAVRGLAHELGHALLLWGHSLDRDHLLWGAAPPLRATPSCDEQRAALLLRLLPHNLDLTRYGPASGS